jgi:hypothetical protein
MRFASSPKETFDLIDPGMPFSTLFEVKISTVFDVLAC